MSELILLPHASRLLIGCLLDAEEVTAIVEDRVVSDGSDNQVGPWVRVTQFPGRIIGPHYWLEQTLFQVDCWGPGGNDRKIAHDLAETCRAALVQRFSGTYHFAGVSGVVTSVEAGGISEGFDPDDPGKARDRFDVVVMAHPAPPLTSE